MTRQRRSIAKLTESLDSQLQELGIEYLSGQAKFTGPRQVLVSGRHGDEEIEADKIILATGARPFLPEGYQTNHLIGTHEQFITMPDNPKSLAIIGGGHIGCEFASIFAATGTRVTLIERGGGLLPDFRQEAGQVLERHFLDMGITVIKNETMPWENLEMHEDHVRLHPTNHEPIDARQVLLATGRRGDLQSLQLDKAGIQVVDNDYVTVDEHLQTTNPDIYAAGDVNGVLRMAHVANAQATAAARNALGANDVLDYQTIPVCIWTNPEIAVIGMHKAQAEQQGLPVRTGRVHFVETVRAAALDEVRGFVDLTCHGDTGQVLGAMIVGLQAGEMISHIALGMRLRATALDLARLTYPHPSFSEAVGKAARRIQQ
jgi:dihydrolipoamide dehydrogenase